MGGCQTKSLTIKRCEVQKCPRYGHLLEVCDCIDDLHYGAFNGKNIPMQSVQQNNRKENDQN